MRTNSGRKDNGAICHRIRWASTPSHESGGRQLTACPDWANVNSGMTTGLLAHESHLPTHTTTLTQPVVPSSSSKYISVRGLGCKAWGGWSRPTNERSGKCRIRRFLIRQGGSHRNSVCKATDKRQWGWRGRYAMLVSIWSQVDQVARSHAARARLVRVCVRDGPVGRVFLSLPPPLFPNESQTPLFKSSRVKLSAPRELAPNESAENLSPFPFSSFSEKCDRSKQKPSRCATTPPSPANRIALQEYLLS